MGDRRRRDRVSGGPAAATWGAAMIRRVAVCTGAMVALAGCSSAPAPPATVTVTSTTAASSATATTPVTAGASSQAESPAPTPAPDAPATTVPPSSAPRGCMGAIVRARYLAPPASVAASEVRRVGFTNVTARIVSSDAPSGSVVDVYPIGSALPCQTPITLAVSAGRPPATATTTQPPWSASAEQLPSPTRS